MSSSPNSRNKWRCDYRSGLWKESRNELDADLEIHPGIKIFKIPKLQHSQSRLTIFEKINVLQNNYKHL